MQSQDQVQTLPVKKLIVPTSRAPVARMEAPSPRPAPMAAVEETEPQTQLEDEGSVVSDGGDNSRAIEQETAKPWARLIGMGPTTAVGVIEIFERLVVFGNAAKNSKAHVRFDDARIRLALLHVPICFSCCPHYCESTHMQSQTHEQCLLLLSSASL